MTVLRPLFSAALLSASFGVLAEPGFAVHNEAALARTTALPALGEARVVAAGTAAYDFRVDWTSEFVTSDNTRESLLLDGETQRLSFGARYGLAPGVELTLDLPLYLTDGGVLDSAIESWHSFFSLPDGGRPTQPRNQFRYRYIRDGQTLLDVKDGHDGPGDVELGIGVSVRDDLTLRALVKMPSGSQSHLTGGNAGTAIWLDYDPFKGSSRWLGYLSAGGSYNAKSDVLREQNHNYAVLGGAGVGFRILPMLAAIVQFNAHSALYRGSQTDALKRPGGELAFGGRLTLGPHWQIDLGAQEDVITESSPDFSIHLGLAYR